MKTTFRVIDVSKWSEVSSEQMGSKDKLWLDKGGEYWLFKYPRSGTGEHWAEKVAAEIATLLQIPCAQVELAERGGMLGTISRRFVDADETLVHGNELMAQYVPGYDPGLRFKQREHRIDLITECVSRVAESGPDGDVDPTTVLISYFVLDAIIGNTDRHHENWAVIERDGTDTRLAPTYDHASSMGRELSDEKRIQKLQHWDAAHYLEGGSGAVYLADGSKVPPFRVVEGLRSIGYATIVETWRERLVDVGSPTLLEVCDRVPERFMSEAARTFARAVLEQSFLWLTESKDE